MTNQETGPERDISSQAFKELRRHERETLRKIEAEARPANDPLPEPDRPDRLKGTLGVRWS